MPRRPFAPLVTALLAAGCSMSAPVESPPADRFVSIFDGTSLDGWVIENGGRFSARDGLLVLDQGTGWLRSVAEYGDFVLALDFRFLEKEANSGIFIRTAATSKDDENGWPDNGYQVQCMDILEGTHPLATMIEYDAGDPGAESDLDAIRAAYRPTGEWNSYEIRCEGEELAVKLNGVLVTTASSVKQLRGHVGIQGENGKLEFRDLRIRELQ